jgi:hypothetical protein
MTNLYVRVNLKETPDEPVQFVGVYVLRWGKDTEPSAGFRMATDEEIFAEAARVPLPKLKTIEEE